MRIKTYGVEVSPSGTTSIQGFVNIGETDQNVEYENTLYHMFLGAFAELRKATISFVMGVRPSVCPSARTEQISYRRTDFHEI